MAKVTTTKALIAMRDYVRKLKEQWEEGSDKDESRITRLLTILALHEGFVAYYGRKIPQDEFIAQLQRLEASDTVGLLIFYSTGASPQCEDLVLLDPTRVDAYSSAILVAAR